MSYEKQWKETDSVEDFLTKIYAPSDAIIVVLEKSNISVHNDSNGYVFINLHTIGDENGKQTIGKRAIDIEVKRNG